MGCMGFWWCARGSLSRIKETGEIPLKMDVNDHPINTKSDVDVGLWNLKQMSLPTSLRSSSKSPQINILFPHTQGLTHHYGYRADQNYLSYLESILKADPTVDPSAFHNALSFTRR
jgi:hypothetical protein